MKKRDAVGRSPVIALLCAAVLVGCGNDKPEALVLSARQYLEKHDINSAIVQLKSALQKNPDMGEARFLLGQAYLETQEVLAAEKELRKAIELGYPAGVVNPYLAHVRVLKGEYKEVIKEYSNAETATPRASAELHTALGEARLALGEMDAAGTEFTAAQAADAKYPPAFLGEARLLTRHGDVEGALKRVEIAIEIAPADPESWTLKGALLAAKGQPDEAIKSERKAIEVRRDFIPAHVALVSDLIKANKPGDAATAFNDLKAIAPKNPQTLYVEAVLRLEERDLAAARDAIQGYQRLVPTDLRAVLLAATIQFRMNSYAEAEANLLTVLRNMPRNDYARRLLVGTYLAKGETSRAVDALNPLLDRIDRDPAMLNIAGELYLRNGEPAVAERYFKRAAAVDPAGTNQRTGIAITRLAQGDTERGLKELELAAAADPGVRADLVLIAVSMKQGDFAKALAAIDSLEKKQPDKPLAHNLRGLALVAKKDNAAARKSFERALALDPIFAPAMLNLVRLDFAEQKSADAQKRLEAFIARNPGNTQALLALAELRIRNKAPQDEVVGLLAKAIAAHPSDAAPRLALVNYYLYVKDPKKAVAAGQEALAANPDRPEILDALAKAQSAAGDTNQALVTYTRLSEALPTSPIPLLRMAELQSAGKDYDAAARSLQRALAIKPDLVSAQRALIALDVGNERVPQAIEIARTIQKQRPKESIGYLLEGDVHASKKAWPAALAAYRTAVKQAGTPDAAMKLHAALVASGQPGEANKLTASWLKDHPDHAAFRFYVAEKAGQSGDYATARKHYEYLLEKDSENPVVLNNLAWIAWKMKAPGALEYAEKANRLAPNQAAIMDTLGAMLVQKGDAERGVDLLKKAVEQAPTIPTIRLNLAEGLIKTGDKAAATKELDALARLGDKFPGQADVARLMKML